MNLKIYSDTDLYARHVSRTGPVYKLPTLIPTSDEILYDSKYSWHYGAEPSDSNHTLPYIYTWTTTTTGSYVYTVPVTHNHTMVNYNTTVPSHTHAIQGYNTTYTYYDEVANIANK